MADLVPVAPQPAFALPPQLDRLRALAAQPAVRRALPWFAGLGTVGAVALGWAVLSAPPQRELYAQLGDAERAGVVAALDGAGIGYTIDNSTGALTVAEDQLYRARMVVAADGALAVPDAQTSLDNLPLGASRTLEGERLRAARERELTLTIKEIDGVESVRVHLAEGNKSVFVRDDAPPSASVMVRMARGRQLSDSQVAAITNLVAASAPGMRPDAVRVVDQQGRLLSDPSSGPDGKGENERLKLQTQLETKLRGQLDQLLTPILGPGQFSSEIQIELDMDEVTSARESYDKEGVIRSESQAQTQAAAAAGGVPGVLANTPPPPTTLQPGAPQPTVPGAPAAPTETSATRTYELGREVAVSNAAPGKVRRLSVAVAISQEAMKKQGRPTDIEALKALVSAAVGANPQRGDQVAVLARPFEPSAEASVPFYEAPWFPLALRSVVGLLVVALVLLVAVRPLLRLLKRDPLAPEAAENGVLAGAGTTALPPATDAPEEDDRALLGQQVELAQRLIEEKPEDAVIALRRMLKPAAGGPA